MIKDSRGRMDVTSDEQLELTSICSHCERAIPYSNKDLHFVHCSRNLEKCKVCGDMVPKQFAEEHFLSTHAPVVCSLCSETMDRKLLDVHNGEICSRRNVTCEYCEFPLPATDLLEHQDVCGNRTELCHLCHKYVRLRERDAHISRCNGVNSTAESSRSSRNTEPPERHPRSPRRHQGDFTRKRVLVSIAITGIAVLLGSLLFQKKSDHSQSE